MEGTISIISDNSEVISQQSNVCGCGYESMTSSEEEIKTPTLELTKILIKQHQNRSEASDSTLGSHNAINCNVSNSSDHSIDSDIDEAYDAHWFKNESG